MGASLPLAVLGTDGCSPPDSAVLHRPISGGFGVKSSLARTPAGIFCTRHSSAEGGVPGAIRPPHLNRGAPSALVILAPSNDGIVGCAPPQPLLSNCGTHRDRLPCCGHGPCHRLPRRPWRRSCPLARSRSHAGRRSTTRSISDRRVSRAAEPSGPTRAVCRLSTLFR
jgi:hypothetical protein